MSESVIVKAQKFEAEIFGSSDVRDATRQVCLRLAVALDELEQRKLNEQAIHDDFVASR